MEYIRRIHDFEKLKILVDARRLAILRLLMSAPATLSQLGQVLGEHPAQVRYHLKKLEGAGLVEMVETRVVRGFVEKYYRATARAFVFNELIVPESADGDAIVALGSHDLALEILAQQLHQRERNALELLVLPVGSLEGLIALRQGTAQIAGCHLLDTESGEYNLTYVRHLFPDQDIALITLAHREQGLLAAPGNPHHLQGIEDLAREDLVFVNRNRGSGTRLWLDRQLELMSLPPTELQGYGREVRTHTAVAEMVVQGSADVGLGLRAAARQYGLEFIPLFEERFDLVVPRERLDEPRMSQLFDYLQSIQFRQSIESLGGYNASHTGEQIKVH